MSTSASRRRWRWWVATIFTPLLFGALTTLLMAAVQSISTEGGLAELERQALGWMLLRRPAREPDPRIVMVALDTQLYEEREAPYLPPATGPGRPLESYRK